MNPRRIDRTADGHALVAGETILYVGSTIQAFVIQDALNVLDRGLVTVEDGVQIHLSICFFVKKNALLHKRQTISQKLDALKREQNMLAVGLKALDKDIAREPD